MLCNCIYFNYYIACLTHTHIYIYIYIYIYINISSQNIKYNIWTKSITNTADNPLTIYDYWNRTRPLLNLGDIWETNIFSSKHFVIASIDVSDHLRLPILYVRYTVLSKIFGRKDITLTRNRVIHICIQNTLVPPIAGYF